MYACMYVSVYIYIYIYRYVYICVYIYIYVGSGRQSGQSGARLTDWPDWNFQSGMISFVAIWQHMAVTLQFGSLSR